MLASLQSLGTCDGGEEGGGQIPRSKSMMNQDLGEQGQCTEAIESVLNVDALVPQSAVKAPLFDLHRAREVERRRRIDAIEGAELIQRPCRRERRQQVGQRR